MSRFAKAPRQSLAKPGLMGSRLGPRNHQNAAKEVNIVDPISGCVAVRTAIAGKVWVI